jgi:hypothetical protein
MKQSVARFIESAVRSWQSAGPHFELATRLHFAADGQANQPTFARASVGRPINSYARKTPGAAVGSRACSSSNTGQYLVLTDLLSKGYSLSGILLLEYLSGEM